MSEVFTRYPTSDDIAETFLEHMTKPVGAPGYIQTLTCPTCKGKVKGFYDDLSLREWKISGMCQECQDAVFDDYEDDDRSLEDRYVEPRDYEPIGTEGNPGSEF